METTTILIIEDVEDDYIVIHERLTNEGFKVLPPRESYDRFMTQVQGLVRSKSPKHRKNLIDWLAGFEIDCIILDLDLLNENNPDQGLELREDLFREALPGIPAILFTKYHYLRYIDKKNDPITERFGKDGICQKEFEGIKLHEVCFQCLLLELARFKKIREAQLGAKTVVVFIDEWSSTTGGIASFNRELCKSIASMGYHVICYGKAFKPHETKECEQNFGSRLRLLGYEEGLAAFMEGGVPLAAEYVITHDHITGNLGLDFKEKNPRTKWIHFIHTDQPTISAYKSSSEGGTSIGKAEEKQSRQILLSRKCDGIVAVGPFLQRRFSIEMEYFERTVHSFIPGLMPVKREIDPNRDVRNHIIHTMGRINDGELKGVDIFEGIIQQLYANRSPNWELEFYIRGLPSEDSVQFQFDVSRRCEIPKKYLRVLEYTSSQDRLEQDLFKSSLSIMPSKTEGFGLVGLEAISVGIPLLLSRESGLAETILGLNGIPNWIRNGWILDVDDSRYDQTCNAWHNRVREVLSNLKFHQSMAKLLRETYSKEYTWEKSVNELFNFVDSEVRARRK